MTTPQIVIGEHTITIAKNGEQATPTLEDMSAYTDVSEPVKSEPPAAPTLPDAADEYFTGGAIKALKEEGVIGGYLVVWGDETRRDKQGEFFTPNTEMRLEYYKERPVLYHHGMGEADSVKIGTITDLKQDEHGLYATARLSLNDPDPNIRTWANQAWNEIKNDTLFWSSGSIGHLVDVLPNGQITKWPLVEGSLTPNPAEPHRTKVDAIKEACSQLTCAEAPPEEPPAKEAAAPEEAKTDTPPPTNAANAVPQPKRQRRKRGKTMLDIALVEGLREDGFDDTQILQFLARMSEAGGGEPEPMMQADDDEEEDEEAMMSFRSNGSNGKAGKSARYESIKQELEALKNELHAQKTAPATETVPAATGAANGKSGGDFGAPTYIKRDKYHHMQWQDMLFMKSILDGAKKRPDDPDLFARALVRKIRGDKEHEWSEQALGAMKAMAPIKDDEVNYSTLASFGDEFVPDLWRGQLWETPRLDNPVFREMQVIEMPSDPYNIPIEGADPTIYAVSETADENQLGINDSNAAIPDTQVGTSNTTLNAGKLAARIQISSELVEDSIIPVAQHWRFKAVRKMEDARDAVILSADATTGTTNINNSGGAIGATSKFLYGGGDGLLHLPLVDNTAVAVDMGGAAPTLAKLREARTKLDTEILADFGNLVYFTDPVTSVALASLDEVLDSSIRGAPGTVNSGMVGAIDSIPVYVTSQMSLALNTGFVSSTAASNTLGRVLLVHVPSWFVGFRRNVQVNLAFEPAFDAWTLVVSMRMALARRATDVASLLYNIKV